MKMEDLVINRLVCCSWRPRNRRSVPPYELCGL